MIDDYITFEIGDSEFSVDFTYRAGEIAEVRVTVEGDVFPHLSTETVARVRSEIMACVKRVERLRADDRREAEEEAAYQERAYHDDRSRAG